MVGHTDTVGNNDYNKTLSDKRAVAVSIRLVGMGVSGKMIKKARYGETSPGGDGRQ
ncbi:MAG: OmpA family protein [Acidiferrobacterales bacterium]